MRALQSFSSDAERLTGRRYAIQSIAAYALFTLTPTVFAQKSGLDTRYEAWDSLLRRHVRWLPGEKQSRVDYRSLQTERTALKTVLAEWSALSAAQFAAMPRGEQMAFLINAYNGFTLELVLGKYPDLKSIKDIGSFVQSAWKRKFFSLLGEERHLDWIEHEQLRPRYAEPRVHAALNCASIGCPALRPEAFTAARLEAQLEDGMARFVGDATRNRLQGGKLQVSSIFKWFREDFEKGNAGFKRVEDVFARYAEHMSTDPAERALLKAGGVPITFLDYDWALNDLGR